MPVIEFGRFDRNEPSFEIFDIDAIDYTEENRIIWKLKGYSFIDLGYQTYDNPFFDSYRSDISYSKISTRWKSYLCVSNDNYQEYLDYKSISSF